MHVSCNDFYKCVACSLVLPSGSLGWLANLCLIFWLEKVLVPSSDSDRVIIKIVNGLKKKKRHVGQFSLFVFINVKG